MTSSSSSSMRNFSRNSSNRLSKLIGENICFWSSPPPPAPPPPTTSSSNANAKNSQTITAAITSSSSLTPSNHTTNIINIIESTKSSLCSFRSSSSENMFCFSMKLNLTAAAGNQALGILVVPAYDMNTQRDMGLVIMRIEPNGRIHHDGRLKVGDRIVEINRTSLKGIDFSRAQAILRDAIRAAAVSAVNGNGVLQRNGDELEFKVIRKLAPAATAAEMSSTPIPGDQFIESVDQRFKHFNENLDLPNKENHHHFDDNNDNNNNNSRSTNLSALYTRRFGKRVSVQLIKGADGLGFKLAARDNCSVDEFSPIYIKSILPASAAMTDGRLQRGDRLLEVNSVDMTQKTLHEAVNLLRELKLGSPVEIVVSRQEAIPQSASVLNFSISNHNNQTTTSDDGAENEEEQQGEVEIIAAQVAPLLLINDQKFHGDQSVSFESENLNQIERQLKQQQTNNERLSSPLSRHEFLTFEIELDDETDNDNPGSGGGCLGISVKGKTAKRHSVAATTATTNAADLGIFVRTVINGGAAFKDGRLRPNDQLLSINGLSLIGKSNDEAMLMLKEAMEQQQQQQQQQQHRKSSIELSIARRLLRNNESFCSLNNSSRKSIDYQHHYHHQQQREQDPLDLTSIFARDAPNRRSIIDKRTKHIN